MQTNKINNQQAFGINFRILHFNRFEDLSKKQQARLDALKLREDGMTANVIERTKRNGNVDITGFEVHVYKDNDWNVVVEKPFVKFFSDPFNKVLKFLENKDKLNKLIKKEATRLEKIG